MSPRQLTKSGFTLLELLLSMSLSVALLAAVSTSILTHYRARDSADRQIECARVLLAISRDLKTDLSHFASSITSTEVSSHLEHEAVTERILNFNYFFQYQRVQIFGSEDYLALGYTVPAPITSGIDSQRPVQMRLVQHSAIWSSQHPSLLQVPYVKNSQEVGFLTFPTDTQASFDSGVCRYLVQQGNPCKLVHSTTFPSAVSSIRFRYLDSGQWCNSWNSITKGYLPQAIEASVNKADDGEWHRIVHFIDVADVAR